MEKFQFIRGGVELLPTVKPLWEKLNHHHKDKSTNFKCRYENFTFEQRVKRLSVDDTLKTNIDLIMDNSRNQYIGYCISTVNRDSVGEVDSLYLNSDYRGYGLGDELMERAIKWIDSNEVKSIIIGVAEGNEEVLKFYERYGFYKRTTILERTR